MTAFLCFAFFLLGFGVGRHFVPRYKQYRERKILNTYTKWVDMEWDDTRKMYVVKR